VILIVKSSFALPTSLMRPTGPTLLMALLVTLSGCGQTGPLYMPNKPVGHGAHRAPAAATAPGTHPAAPIQLSPPAPAAGVTMPAANSNSNNTEATNQIPAQLPAQPPQATQQ
jgi:predicted small lipoprotein YifL